MRPTRPRRPESLKLVAERAHVEVPEIERLRLESLLHDSVTGLTLHPFADLKGERVANLGVVYVQLGRFAGVESLYGWELYDRILRVTAASLREDIAGSTLAPGLLTICFNGSDGVFLLFDLARRTPGRRAVTLGRIDVDVLLQQRTHGLRVAGPDRLNQPHVTAGGQTD